MKIWFLSIILLLPADQAYASFLLKSNRAVVLPWHFNVFGTCDLRDAFSQQCGGETFIIVEQIRKPPKQQEQDSNAFTASSRSKEAARSREKERAKRLGRVSGD